MIIRKPCSLLCIIIALWFFSSCASYRSGFITELNEPFGNGQISCQKLDSLHHKKEKLTDESNVIVQSLLHAKQNHQPFLAADINHLFENLHHHYQIDSTYHYLFQKSDNDSVKCVSWLSMIESANDYSKLFQKDKTIRRTINRGDQAYGIGKRSLLKSQRFYWTPSARKYIKDQRPTTRTEGTKCRFQYERLKDNIAWTAYNTFGVASGLFSRLMDKIHGKHEPELYVGKLMSHIKEWDIVLMKSTKRSTDIFIPGYFGHTGIYLGDSLFAEAVQKGVVISNPYHFAEAEMFLVIRQKNITDVQKSRMKELLKRHAGKKYDFNFNICSSDRVVCSELIYLVYENIHWFNQRNIGVYTISPDDIARTALDHKDLSFTLYFDKNQMIENPNREFIEDLLK